MLIRVHPWFNFPLWQPPLAAVEAQPIGFAFARQVFAVRRIVEPTDRVTRASEEIADGITAALMLADPQAHAQRVLSTFRTHWGIECKAHARRDKSFREDTCQVRNHNAARVLVAFRQLAIFLCEINAQGTRLQKDARCLPELFRCCSFNGLNKALAWLQRPKAFIT